MSKRTWHALRLMAATTSVIVTGSAAAQEIPLRWHVSAGLNQPVGQTSNLLRGGGYSVGGGFSLTSQRGSPLSLRFDLNYTDNSATQQLLSDGAQQSGAQVDNGRGNFTSVTANAVYKVPLVRGAHVYGIAGVGVYHSEISLTQTVLYGGGYCDPYWSYCYRGVGVGDVLVASESTTKFGWNAGLGIEFPLYYGQSWFVEARFNRIETQTPIEYVPITVGYRF